MEAAERVQIEDVEVRAARKEALRVLARADISSPGPSLVSVTQRYVAATRKGVSAVDALEAACGLEGLLAPPAPLDSIRGFDDLAGPIRRGLDEESVLAGAYEILARRPEPPAPIVLGGRTYRRPSGPEYPLVIGCDEQLERIVTATRQLFFYEPAAQQNPLAECMDRAVLLHGPPGTGKSSLCRYALAHARELSARSGVPFRYEQFEGSDFSKWLGDSAKALKGKLARVREPSGVGMFLVDDYDLVVASREDPSAGSGSLAVTGQLMQELSGIRADEYGNVLFLATTNLRGGVDPAMRRRFTSLIEVPNFSRKNHYRSFLDARAPWLKDGLATYLVDASFDSKLTPALLDHVVRGLDRQRRGVPSMELFDLSPQERLSVYEQEYLVPTVADARRLVERHTAA